MVFLKYIVKGMLIIGIGGGRGWGKRRVVGKIVERVGGGEVVLLAEECY